MEPDHEHVHTFLFLLEPPWCDGAAFLQQNRPMSRFHPKEEHSDRCCCCFTYTTSTCTNTPSSHLTKKRWILIQRLVRREGFLQVVTRSQSQVGCVLHPSLPEPLCGFCPPAPQTAVGSLRVNHLNTLQRSKMITEKFAEQSPVLPDQHITLKAAKKTRMECHTLVFYGEKLAAEHRLTRRRQAAETMLVRQSP